MFLAGGFLGQTISFSSLEAMTIENVVGYERKATSYFGPKNDWQKS